LVSKLILISFQSHIGSILAKARQRVGVLFRGLHTRQVGRAQLNRSSPVDAHTVAQNQYTGKQFDDIHFFVMALCFVQKCELSYNV
jgi:hypothetical protein